MAGAPTILFAWELGANLGHVLPLRALMLETRNLNCTLAFAAHDLSHLQLLAPELAVSVFQAPVWPAMRRALPARIPSSYSDILGSLGFGQPERLEIMLKAWDNLVSSIAPAVIVADHSPGLILSLIGKDIPVISIGNAYTMPPAGLQRFPSLRPELASAYPDEDILASINRVLTIRGQRRVKSLPEALRTHQRAVFGLPELDPYASYRNEKLLLPPEDVARPTKRPAADHIFAYLSSGFPNIEAIAQSLSRLNAKLTVYLRGDVGPISAFLKMRGHTVLTSPPKLAEILPSVSHVISSAGAYTCQAALMAGRPHLMFPLQHEAALNAEMVKALGCGVKFDTGLNEFDLAKQIAEAVADSKLSAHTLATAEGLKAWSQKNGGTVALRWITEALKPIQPVSP